MFFFLLTNVEIIRKFCYSAVLILLFFEIDKALEHCGAFSLSVRISLSGGVSAVRVLFPRLQLYNFAFSLKLCHNHKFETFTYVRLNCVPFDPSQEVSVSCQESWALPVFPPLVFSLPWS